jgi:hypothetical protein
MAGLLTLPFFDVGAGITPADGALLFFNVVGSETDKDTFPTASATPGTAHTNPVVANIKGVFPAIYLVGDYDWVLTDKNLVQKNTGSVSELVTGSGQLENVLSRDTLNAAVIDTSLQAGLSINIAERTTGNGGGAMWDVVLSSTVTENTNNIVQCTGVGTLSLVQRELEKPYGVATVAQLKTTDLIPGQFAETVGYYDGWAAALEPEGGAKYSISTLAEVQAVKGGGYTPDGFGDITLNNSFIAVLDISKALYLKQFGAVGDGVADDTDELDAYFLFAESLQPSTRITLEMGDGIYRTTRKLTANNLKRQGINGNFIIQSDHTDDWVLKLYECTALTQKGLMQVNCKGDTTYANRGNQVGLVIENCAAMTGEAIHVFFAQSDGIRMVGTSTQMTYDFIRTQYCGAGIAGATSAPEGVVNSHTTTGTVNSAAQRDILTMSAIPQELKDYIDKATATAFDTNDSFAAYIELDGNCHNVFSYSGNDLTVWPWIVPASVGNSAKFIFGAGILSSGGDTSVITIQNHDALVCGVGYAGYSLYPASMQSFVSQGCGAALVIGKSTSDASVSFNASRGYFEASLFDLIQGTEAECPIYIGQTTAFDVSKAQRLKSADASGVRASTELGGAAIRLDHGSVFTDQGINQRDGNTTLNFWSPDFFSTRANANVVTIVDNPDFADLFRRKVQHFYWLGNLDGMTPTGAITFNPPAGATLNATTTQVFNTATGPVHFILSRKSATEFFVEALNSGNVTKV